MRIRIIALASLAFALSGCAFDRLLCKPNCQSKSHTSSSLVGFLYPDGQAPPREDTVPELSIPLRVGLAFLPSQRPAGMVLEPARKEELLVQIRKRFADRKFIADIVVIPDYYLANKRGFAGLEGVQRLYNVDLMALVSYDQTTHTGDNDWSLAYLTIVGAYVVKGTRHDISTLVDLAVIDPATRSLVLRAGGTDIRHGNTTLVDYQRETRASSVQGFTAATAQMIEHFDAALVKFESDVRAGTAHVRVVNRANSPRGGGGAMGWLWLLPLMGGVYLRSKRQ